MYHPNLNACVLCYHSSVSQYVSETSGKNQRWVLPNSSNQASPKPCKMLGCVQAQVAFLYNKWNGGYVPISYNIVSSKLVVLHTK